MARTLRERFEDGICLDLVKHIGWAKLSDNAKWLLEQRYFVQRYDADTCGIRKEKSFAELARRVARTIASAETQYLDITKTGTDEALAWLQKLEKNIASDILNRRFLFNSPCLFSAGAGLTVLSKFAELIYKDADKMSFEDYQTIYRARTQSQQLFACFVINVPDSIEGIFNSVRDAGVISKFGGGCGANFGHLRESGSSIREGTGGVASGPVSFMETWNTMGAVVVQGGKRRAALMGMLFDNHPDIYQFVDCKTEDGKLPYFNISVAVSDKLMSAARSGESFDLISRADAGKVVQTVDARDLLNRICESAWKRGDPGVFFIDRARADNILKMGLEWDIEATNPCGEQPLPNYTSCNLGSINVEAFVKDGKFDWRGFEDQVFRSMYYLDLVIDACSYPLDEIGRRTRMIRPVGLGIMGLANASILQGIVYGSEQFNSYCRDLGDVMARSALMATVQIVKDAGKEPFPEHDLVSKLFGEFARDMDEKQKAVMWGEDMSLEDFKWLAIRMKGSNVIPPTLANTMAAMLNPAHPMDFGDIKATLEALRVGRIRNSRRLSIAPTGSISMLLDTSSGIEPNFAWGWNRKIAKVDGSGTEEREFWHELLSDAQKAEYRATGRISDPAFVTAYDITTEQHVNVTGIFARIVDSGVSKTVNLPAEATVDDVRKVYNDCYDLGCKGITIYRDGSRNGQPIEVKKTDEPAPGKGKIKERPGLVVFGKTIKEKTPWGSIYITLNFDGDEPFEMFINVGKSGSELKAMTEALSRVISIGLRSGCRLEDFIDTLKGLSGKEYWMFDFDDEHVARSIPDAVAILLERLIERKNGADEPQEGGVICPECGAPMEMISGCAYCFSCGYSPCK